MKLSNKKINKQSKRFRFVGALSLIFLFTTLSVNAQTYETDFAKPLHNVLQEISTRFHVKIKCNADTVGKVVKYADFRIRPYSVEESLKNVLSLFDYMYQKQGNDTYKIRPYEYARRNIEDGKKMIAWLETLYKDSTQWSARRACLKKEVRERLQIDPALAQCVKAKPILSKIRKHNGYSVQNFALETLPGVYVCGSIYSPLTRGKHPLIICPNGHWPNGRYNSDLQLRYGSLARMGAVCVSYDLFGWGESALQVTPIAHRTSVADVDQILNGITILNYMLTRKNIDTTRVAANGGSGGGTQVVMLTLLDNRFTAACSTVNISSHFDGGCPCESGMPVTLACGGTNIAEMMATFAPKPLLVISDGHDWTQSVPYLEYPYLQKIYGFYHAKDKVSNVHLPKEGHSYGINKRIATYNFFIKVFGLNRKMLDESKVTIEPKEAMLSFGKNGENMPKNAIRDNYEAVEKYFHKNVDAKMRANEQAYAKAVKWVKALNLTDKTKADRVVTLIYNHLREVRNWHNTHPYTLVPDGINPDTGKPLTMLEREVMIDSSQPKSYHQKFMSGLRKTLTEAQVEKVLDFITVGKVEFTMKGYHVIVPDLTPKEAAYILNQLETAREQAIDYKSMKEISAIFEIYKTNCEHYLNSNGRNWHQLYKAFYKKIQAEKAAKKAAEKRK